MIEDDPAAVLGSMPTMPPVVKRKWREFSITGTITNISPEVMDLLMYGQSPGPHIVLGEN